MFNYRLKGEIIMIPCPKCTTANQPLYKCGTCGATGCNSYNCTNKLFDGSNFCNHCKRGHWSGAKQL